MKNKKIAVELFELDWELLINFVQGDLANMDEADQVKKDMNQILDAIRISICTVRLPILKAKDKENSK